MGGTLKKEDVDAALQGLVSVLTGTGDALVSDGKDRVKSVAAFSDERMYVPKDMGASSTAGYQTYSVIMTRTRQEPCSKTYVPHHFLFSYVLQLSRYQTTVS